MSKIMLVSKFMMSRHHNQAMKFGEVLEYNKRNIFFSKTMQNVRQGD